MPTHFPFIPHAFPTPSFGFLLAASARQSDDPEADSMPISLSEDVLNVLYREADSGARRLLRRLRLPEHDRDDLRQDLLADLIQRLKWFDPRRGTLGVFAGTIVRHRALRMAARIFRERAVFTQLLHEGERERARSDNIAEGDGYAAILEQTWDRLTAVERRLDLVRALGLLSQSDLSLCVELVERSPTEISRSGRRSRASLYRQLKEIRLQMLTAGISAAA